ncbi:hypothetical protein [Ferrimonas senticii]|uniref:hypothetical protein n=1 Tax=Ferrimonas senticii TaxID=394566 RepID=UPI0004803A68|nr:hypothetical protein [Ferrimonas senticii]
MESTLNHLINKYKALESQLDLTCTDDLSALTAIAQSLLEQPFSLFDLREKESDPRFQNHLGLQLGLKLAISRRCVEAISVPMELTVVFAMYGETQRMQSAANHQHGEDFLRRKVAQLQWLFDGIDNIQWYIDIVDDGCPDGSGAMAREMINQMGLSRRIRVHYLEDGIKAQLPVCAGMQQARDSQKGGSIAYGMWLATRRNRSANHVVCYTDADLSTHLGQVGLLMQPICAGHCDIACGSRREPQSVVLKQGTRNERGKLFIYLWKQMLPQLHFLVDTQCGFKAFRASVLEPLLYDRIENRFAFDIELLLRAELIRENRINKAAIGWIDSDALSTTTDIGPYLNMLKAVVLMYHNYLPLEQHASAVAKVLASMDEQGWQSMLAELEPFLAKRSLTEVLNSVELTPERLQRAAAFSHKPAETVN